ncbi:major capsid protein [Bacteroides thetaiotaomicron]|uniref:major capsid protein n=1 Tax=Bacteroides thetaiotaomicron TaxID=818 RepID=UPI0010486809|nr:major capsid protein [Bacteroides thetaiotaomicron]
MANIMSLKSLRNKTSRNGFDLSSKRNFTAKAGELLPVKTWEVLPGDTFKIDLKTFTRTQPLNTAAFARMREYYDFYFVPYDLLWNKANTTLTQMYDNPQHALDSSPLKVVKLDGSMPFTDLSSISRYLNSLAPDSVTVTNKANYFGYNRALCSAKLMEYLGYGYLYYYAASVDNTFVKRPLHYNLYVSLFNLLAYQKIYADYYRDSQWERVSPSCFNVDYMPYSTGSSGMMLSMNYSDFYENYSMFDLRYCNWQKDLFHGVVPNQQYGDVASVSFDSNVLINGQSVVNTSAIPSHGTTSTITSARGSSAIPALSPLTVNPSFSILALRQAEFLQKWKEITQSGNKDYKEQVEKHWNVSPGDGFSEMCTYLGGISSSLDINEVVNNNITGDNAADIAGKGTGVSNGVINFNSQGRYGVVMCIYHCLPLIDYTTDFVSPSVTRVNAADFAIPEFDRVGMQTVPLSYISNGPLSVLPLAIPNEVGYAPRYIDYKTDIDTSIGAFKTSLKNWVISYDNQSLANQFGFDVGSPELPVPNPANSTWNYTLFKVNPNSLNPLFAVEVDSSVDTDQFLCSTFFDVKVVRNLDTDGLPY